MYVSLWGGVGVSVIKYDNAQGDKCDCSCYFIKCEPCEFNQIIGNAISKLFTQIYQPAIYKAKSIMNQCYAMYCKITQ